MGRRARPETVINLAVPSTEETAPGNSHLPGFFSPFSIYVNKVPRTYCGSVATLDLSINVTFCSATRLSWAATGLAEQIFGGQLTLNSFKKRSENSKDYMTSDPFISVEIRSVESASSCEWPLDDEDLTRTKIERITICFDWRAFFDVKRGDWT